MTPQPRPALRRADDAALHPALAVAPSQEPPPPFSTRTEGPATRSAGAAGDDDAAKKKRKGKKGDAKRGKDSGAPGTSRQVPLRSPGHATSDALRSGGDKVVALSVRVPKSTRKQLRAVAKHSGTSIDALVTTALNEWLGDPRRW